MNVGILGGGQLAQMLAQSGEKLGHSFIFLDPSEKACAFPLGRALLGAYDSTKLLKELGEVADVVTFEFENVPHTSVEVLSSNVPIFPSARALEITQDRLKEKTTFNNLSIPTTKFLSIQSLQELKEGVLKIGFPCVLKTRSEGYDGKGQKILRQQQDVELAWNELGKRPLLLEEFIEFDREVSIVSVRGQKGEVRFYDLCENEHRNGILRFTKNIHDDPIAIKAQRYATLLLEFMDYVGVFTLEMFQKGNELVANEMAPRVHNSGHWTIEGAQTSQFENHIRAVTGMKLGDTSSHGYCVMANLIGTLPVDLNRADFNIHIYGKDPRPGRKLGHITACYETPHEREDAIIHLRKVTSNS